MDCFENKSIDEIYVQVINLRWRWDGEDKDYIVYMSPFSGHINILNPIGADIFMLCDGKHTISEIVDVLMDTYEGATKERITNDVIELIKYFKSENLVSIYS